jgi:sugar phosphate isomerase/epimerase
MKIGAMLESFKVDLREAVKRASLLGVEGVQVFATNAYGIGTGELNPENMNDTKVKEWLDLLKSHGLVFSAVCGDLGGHGFEDEGDNKWRVEESKRIIDLAKKLECNIVTTHIGVVPAEECTKKEVMRKACRELALYADSIGSAFAVETGPETAQVLFDFLESLGAGGVRVNFDPANLIMCVKDDPVKGVATLGKYIVHTHAKDGVQLTADPVTFEELPLGKGGVDWDAYLKALNNVGFDGFLTIEREVGENPADDIRKAVDFLRSKL